MKLSTLIFIACLAVTSPHYILTAELSPQAQAHLDQLHREQEAKELQHRAETDADDTDDTAPLTKKALTKCRTPKKRLLFHKASAQAIAEQAGLDHDKLMGLPLDIHHTIWSFKTTNRKKAIAQNMHKLFLAIVDIPDNIKSNDMLHTIVGVREEARKHFQNEAYNEPTVGAILQITRYSELYGKGNKEQHHKFRTAAFDPFYATLKELKQKKACWSMQQDFSLYQLKILD